MAKQRSALPVVGLSGRQAGQSGTVGQEGRPGLLFLKMKGAMMKTNTINKALALLRQYGEGCREVSDRWAELANEAYHAGDMVTVDFCMQRALDNLATANAYLGEAKEGCGDK